MADVIKSIGSGKDYSTVNSWYVNWLNTGSSFLGDNEIGQTYGSITETSQTVINTGKTTASKRIYLESAPSERHNGKYDETKAYIYHNFDLGTAKGLIEIEESYVEIRFLQFKHDSAFYRNVSIGNTFSSLVESSIHHNIVKYVGSPASSQVRGIFAQSAGIYRNIVFDFRSAADESKARGIWVWEATGTGLIYQNTVINCGAGFDCNNASGITIKQNYAGDCVVDYQSITGITSSKNISSDSSSPDGASYRGKNSYTDYFVDYNNDDFHLKSTDTVLKDAGDNLGSPYDVDIDGESVTGTWDIGADEYVAEGTTKQVTDSGSGADSISQIFNSLAISDTGSGAEQLAGQASLSLSDAGNGADAAPAISVNVSVADAGSAVDLISQILNSFAVAESGSGADAIAQTIVDFVLLESGAGADSISVDKGGIIKTVTDSGSGSEAISGVTVALSIPDTAAGADLISQILNSLAVQDTGAGSEQISASQLLQIQDSGSGADALASISVSVTVADTGQASDLISQIVASLAVTDSGSGAEVIIRPDLLPNGQVTITFTAKKPGITSTAKKPGITFQ